MFLEALRVFGVPAIFLDDGIEGTSHPFEFERHIYHNLSVCEQCGICYHYNYPWSLGRGFQPLPSDS
jgi:hypothetical protein